MNNKRLIVLDHGFNTGAVFKGLFDEVVKLHFGKTFSFKEGDVLMFEGGTDINPLMYDENYNSYTSKSDHARDSYEQFMFRKAVNADIPMIGICRGAQLICALSGGKLVQHVSNHGQDHSVTDYKGRSYFVTSSHHQMMLPKGTSHKLLADAGSHSSMYIGEHDLNVDVEEDAEIVWFNKTKCLAIQGHPEWAGSSPFVVYCNEYVRDYIQSNPVIQGEGK